MTDLSTPQHNCSDTDVERIRRLVLRHAENIPVLPEVVHRTLTLLDNPDSTPEELETVLQLDPIITGKILSLVNSALFSLQREFANLPDAIVMLGRGPLRNMLLAYSAAPVLKADYSCFGHCESGLWQHSIAVAAAARRLAMAAKLDRDNREMLFLAGLMHDIGKMVVAPYLRDKGISAADHPQDLRRVEKNLAGMDHAEAGALVVTKWDLPETVQETIFGSHGNSPLPDYEMHAACLRASEALAHETGIGYQADQVPIPDAKALTSERLPVPIDDELRAAMIEAIEDALDSLGRLL